MKPSTCCRWPERRSPSRLRNSSTVSVKSVLCTFASQISSTWWYINFVMITSFCSVIEVCLLVHFILKYHWDFSLMPVICLEIGNSKIHDVVTNICLWWLLAISVFNKLSLQRKSTLAYCLTISFGFFFHSMIASLDKPNSSLFPSRFRGPESSGGRGHDREWDQRHWGGWFDGQPTDK